jgi:hypothetical protein
MRMSPYTKGALLGATETVMLLFLPQLVAYDIKWFSGSLTKDAPSDSYTTLQDTVLLGAVNSAYAATIITDMRDWHGLVNIEGHVTGMVYAMVLLGFCGTAEPVRTAYETSATEAFVYLGNIAHDAYCSHPLPFFPCSDQTNESLV